MKAFVEEGRTAKQTVALGLGAVLASILLVTIAVIASSYTAQRVATNARALHWANGALGTAAIARAAVGQAVFFAVDEELGVASPEAVAAAVASAEANLEAVDRMAEGSLDGAYQPPEELAARLTAQAEIGGQVLDLIEQGDPGGAADLRAGSYDSAFEELTDLLALQQQEVAGSISSTETLAGRLDTITRIGVMLALPTLAFTVYRRRARRSMLAAKRRHESEMEIERRSATAKDEFFAAVSHELRTPLTTILGFSEVLMDGSVEPGEQTEMIDLIRRDAIDLERRIDDLVAAARSAAHGLVSENSDFDIEPLLRSIAETTPTDKDIYLEVAPAAVHADPTALRQILRNLVSNAERHGGPTIWLWGRHEEGRYLISVVDDGEGFDPGVLDAAKGPFAHEHSETILRGSIGLGLSAAVALAEAIGASLGYRRVGVWTQVGLFLPLAAEESEAADLESAGDYQEALSA